MDIDFAMEGIGKKVSVERNSVEALSAIAIYEREEKRFVFYSSEDIKKDDIIIDSTGNRFYVTEIEIPEVHQEPLALYAYISTGEKQNVASIAHPQININNAYNSAIGTQGSVTMNINFCFDEMREEVRSSSSPDAEQLNQIVDLLEKMATEKEAPTKGMLAQFSEVVQRNSWISGSIASALLSLAMASS